MVNPRFVIKAVLSGQRLNINVPLTVAGTVNYIGVEAKCTSEWDDCTVVCYIHLIGSDYIAQLGLIYDAERKLYYFPNAERLTLTAGEWSIYFVGVVAESGQEKYKVTSETRYFNVYPNPFASSIPPGNITLDEEAIARATDAQNKANLMIDLYNAGKFTGPKGDPGDPAEIGFVQASVDGTTGNPGCVVSVTENPENTYNMQFAFSGIKGAKGDTGATGPKGDTGPQGAPGRDGTDGRDGVDGQTIDDYVLVQAEQPTSETNKMWLKPTADGDPIMIPNAEEFQAVEADVINLKSANYYVIKTKFPDTFETVPFFSGGGYVRGRIDITTGANKIATTRARRYNSIFSGNYITLGTDDYEYTLFYYNGSTASADYTGIYTDWIKGSAFTLVDDKIGDRVKMVIRHPDNSNITDGDLALFNTIVLVYNLNQIIPTITTKRGNPVYIGELEALARDWYSHRNDIVGGSKAMVYGNNSILNTSSYTREIDCSTFAGMLLRGYSFSQTPYATGIGASPNSWTGNTAYNWVFNPFDYSNYSRVDSQSRTKVRYASQLAEMMIERGQTVPIDRYYANIEPGDVLFFARHDSTTNDWVEPLRLKHINHVAICIAKEKATNAGGWDTTTYPWKHTYAEVEHEDETAPDGVVKIKILEQPQGDTSAIFNNNINTLCLVCRPDLGSI